MESRIDLMVKELAKSIKAISPKSAVSPEKREKEMFLPKAKNDFVIAGIDGEIERLKKSGNVSLADGILRVLELVNIPYEYLMKIYTLMQPNSGTKAEYVTLAAELLNEFSAEKNADMIIRIMQRFDNSGQLLKN